MSWEVHDYDVWQSYIARGRNKWERTLYDGQRNRVQYANKWSRSGDIQIVNPWTKRHPLITIHPDSTMTLKGGLITTYWNSSFNCLDSQSIRYTIWKYAGIQVNRRKGKFYITERDAPIKPGKLQGCRQCSSSGLMDSWCNPQMCGNVITLPDGSITCPTHPDATNLAPWRNWHGIPCIHGDATGHNLKRGQTCYYCNGTKQRLYGERKISVLWDGSPIRVQNGNIYKQPLTQLERMLADHVNEL